VVRVANELRVLLDRDGVHRHVKRIDPHRPRRSFVVIPVVGPHRELATGDWREAGYEFLTHSG